MEDHSGGFIARVGVESHSLKRELTHYTTERFGRVGDGS